MFNKILTILLAAVCSVGVYAQTSNAASSSPHELRIGVADAMIPVSRFRNAGPRRLDLSFMPEWIKGMPASDADAYLRGYRAYVHSDASTTGHLFVGYMYHLTPLIGVGLDADLLTLLGRSAVYDGYAHYVESIQNNVYVVSLLPMVRFTYFEREHVRLYSAVGVGYTCYAGTWAEARFTQQGVGVNTTFLGVSVGGQHVFGSVELGAYNSVYFASDKVEWMPFSRIFSMSIGCRF